MQHTLKCRGLRGTISTRARYWVCVIGGTQLTCPWAITCSHSRRRRSSSSSSSSSMPARRPASSRNFPRRSSCQPTASPTCRASSHTVRLLCKQLLCSAIAPAIAQLWSGLLTLPFKMALLRASDTGEELLFMGESSRLAGCSGNDPVISPNAAQCPGLAALMPFLGISSISQ